MLTKPETELLFRLSLPARAERLVLVRAIIQRTAESAGCSNELCQKLVIAINEACMNIIQHAYRGKIDGQFMIEVARTKQALWFRLEDYAEPVDLDRIRPRELDDIRPGGLGVHFIREIMDSCQMGHLEERRGNFLDMMKNIE